VSLGILELTGFNLLTAGPTAQSNRVIDQVGAQKLDSGASKPRYEFNFKKPLTVQGSELTLPPVDLIGGVLCMSPAFCSAVE